MVRTRCGRRRRIRIRIRIYRWNAATSAYEKIDEASAGTFEYVDTGARRGTTSYYRVTAVQSDGTETLPAGDWTVTAPAA